MTAQESLNQALWNKLPEEVRISIERSVGEGKLAVLYENSNYNGSVCTIPFHSKEEAERELEYINECLESI